MNKQARSWIPSILLLIVLFVGGYWFMTRQFTINNSYSQQDFYESVQNNEVESVYIHPNKEYPTGRVSVDLTNGNSVQFYALDVKEIQDFLGDYSEIALEVGDVPGDNIFLSSVLPIILVAGMAFFLISMMSRQMSGGGGGGTNAKMMNFGKSRAKMTVNEENKVTFKDVAGLEEEKEDLEEVVVTGIFTRKKEGFTGSATQVTGEEIKRMTSGNVLKALEMLDPGFRMNSSNLAGSNPNAIPDFQMRGQASMGNYQSLSLIHI